MKKIKVIIKQIFKIITFDRSYPCIECFSNYQWKINKKGNVEYQQYKTLIEYLNNN